MFRTTTAPTRRSRTAAALVSLALLTGACDAALEAAGDARETVVNGVEVVQFCVAAGQTAQAVSDEDWTAAFAAAQRMQEHAPDEVKADVDLLIDAFSDAMDGNRARLQEEQTRASLAAVASYVEDNCDPR